MNLILRPVEKRDLNDLVELARHLDTVNFPDDRKKIEQGIVHSINSFSEKIKDWKKGVYQFVLEDPEKNKVLGVSKIIACHGTPDKPHFYWEIFYDVRESKTIGIGLRHQVLKLGKDTRGFTEIAGIIVDPEAQGNRLGKKLFYVRFLFMALNRKKFLDRILSELLPPLTSDNKSELWEAYGRKFTGLTYQEADQLSQDNKEFIEALFPQHEIYTCILPLEARQVIGQVGEKSLPVRHLAEKNNLKFLNQIDPFDGGPHYGCPLDQVTCIKQVQSGALKIVSQLDAGKPGLICLTENQKTNFRCIECEANLDQKGNILVLAQSANLIKLHEGDAVSFLPYT